MTSDAGWKTALDNPVVAMLRAEGHVVHVNLVVRADGVDLLLPWSSVHGRLRNENRVVQDLSSRP